MQMLAQRQRTVPGADTFRSQFKQIGLRSKLVQPAQVVENKIQVRILQWRGVGIFQKAKTRSLLGNAPEMFPDAAQQIGKIISFRPLQMNWKDGGEPSDGSAQIRIAIDFLAAMPLQMQPQVIVTQPAVHREKHGSQQHFIDPGAKRLRNLLQQGQGLVLTQFER